jgi:hypothetical protein
MNTAMLFIEPETPSATPGSAPQQVISHADRHNCTYWLTPLKIISSAPLSVIYRSTCLDSA